MQEQNLGENQEKPKQFVVLTIDILRDKKLSNLEKLILGYASSVQEFFASNEYLGEIFDKSPRTIARAKQKLERLGFLVCVEDHGRGKRYRFNYNNYRRNNSDEQKQIYPRQKNAAVRHVEPPRSHSCVVDDKSLISREKSPLEPAKTLLNAKTEVVFAATKEAQERAESLAELLKKRILQNYPTNKIPANYKRNWSAEIEKMHRIDGRRWEDIAKAIEWSANDDFWKRNIWSGGKLRKQYDRLSANAKADFMKNGYVRIEDPRAEANEERDPEEPKPQADTPRIYLGQEYEDTEKQADIELFLNDHEAENERGEWDN